MPEHIHEFKQPMKHLREIMGRHDPEYVQPDPEEVSLIGKITLALTRPEIPPVPDGEDC